MPPLPSLDSIWDSATGVYNRLTGQSNAKGRDSQESHDSNTHITDLTNDDPEIEETNSRKRKVASHVQIGRPNKKPDLRSENEKRLTGDYDLPSDAMPILMPQQPQFEDDKDAFRAGAYARMSKSKPGAAAGAFRPQNTLNRASAQAARSTNVTGSGFMGRKANTFVGKEVNADAFYGSEREPAAKKRKTVQTSQRELQQDPIDVGSDEDDVRGKLKVVGINGKRINQDGQNDRTQRMVRSESQTAPFDGQEWKSSDQILQTERSKPRRRPPNTSQASSRASPAVMTNGHSGKTAAEAVPIDDDTSQEISQHHSQAPPPNSSGSLPDPKAIMNGVNEVTQAKQRRQSEDSVEFTHTKMKSQMPPPAAKSGHAPAVQQPVGQQRARRKIEQDGDLAPKHGVTVDALRYKERRPSEEENTRDKFRRAVPLSQQSANGTAKRRTAMKVDSGQAEADNGSARDSIGSADELAGPTTVASVSPEKRQPQPGDDRARVNGSRSSRSGSPLDLKPSQFTSSKKTETSRTRTATNRRAAAINKSDTFKVPLQAFCSTSCFLLDGDIAMRYDPSCNDLTVERDGMVVAVPGGKCAVHITSAEANQVFFDNETMLLYLKGSFSAVSKGSICISFNDMQGKHWFVDRLMAVCNVAPTMIEKSPDDMRKIVKNQAGHIRESYKKQQELVERNQGLLDRIEAKKTQKAHSADEDTIKYETDEHHEHKRSSRRKNMFGKSIEDDDELESGPPLPKALERSRFFNDTTPRRSTRQAKPIRQKSPTPPPEAPKWTKVHRPERWPHSVVYPNEGARRVTVDFQDLERLDEGEFLNDNVISFALRRIEEKMAPEHKERVHFFNSFFYTALTTKNGKKDFNYDAVKRWTKSKDLLGCDYVVVPINIDLHWFVAIICNLPNLSRRIAADEEDDTMKAEEQLAEEAQEVPSDPIEAPAAAEGERSARQTPENTKGMRNLSLSDDEGTSKTLRPENEGEVADVSETNAPEEPQAPLSAQKAATATGRKGKKRGPPSFNPENPSIITLDSFGSAHTTEVKNLKDYISEEAKAKRGIEVDRGQLQGANIRGAGIPTQSNFCDCGVYLVGYVEQFAKDPQEFATKALTRKLGEESEFEGFDPSQKRDEIRDELLKLQKEQEAEHKAKKAGKKAAAPKTDGQAAASAAATPHPESKPNSKAASPARDTGKMDAAPPPPPRPQSTSWAPAEAGETTAQLAESQDKDLEFEPPRALPSPPKHTGADTHPVQPLQEDVSQEEMLEPRHDEIPDQPPSGENEEPNELLDNLSAVVPRNNQSMELSFDEQLQEAASKDAQAAQIEEDKELDKGPDMIRKEDVIDLGDSDDERNRSAEIPDSQEQRQRRREASATWTGTRKTFAD